METNEPRVGGGRDQDCARFEKSSYIDNGLVRFYATCNICSKNLSREGNLSGTFFAIFRRFQKWNFSGAIAEYAAHMFEF